MHERNKFHQMVIYIEACESGSMFKGLLPNNINIYGTTASNSTHSSVSIWCTRTVLGAIYLRIYVSSNVGVCVNLFLSMHATTMTRSRHFCGV